jgi:hypothetical protein
MGFMVPDAVMDKNLDEVALSDRLFICSREPTTYQEAAVTYNLATIELTPGAGNGDWVKAEGDVSGRKLTLTLQTGIGAVAGTANHGAFCVSGEAVLKFVCPIDEFSIQTGVSFMVASRDIWEIDDPS